MQVRPTRALALVALVVLAGCAGPLTAPGPTATPSPSPTATPTPSPTATPSPTVTPTPEPRVDVDGNLSVEADVLYERVERLMGASVAPGTVTVRDLGDAKEQAVIGDPVGGWLGVPVTSLNESRPAGLTRSNGAVLFDPGTADRAFVERRLVHEFVHVVQLRGDRFDRSALSGRSRDAVTAWRAVAEGSAVYVTDAYVDEHMPGERSQSAVVRESYEAGDPPGNRVTWAPYLFGARYVAERADGPANLTAVFDNPPTTTEQVIHGYGPDEEPPVAYDADVETGADWTSGPLATRGGELLLRTVLRSELPREQAAEAAAGWGNDRLVQVQGVGENDGMAWVLHWDTAEGSETLEAALREYAAARETASEADFEVVRADDRTVVLLAGTGEFLSETQVSAEGLSTTVTVGENVTASDDGRPSVAAPGPVVDAPADSLGVGRTATAPTAVRRTPA
jgi:hypothetical protein